MILVSPGEISEYSLQQVAVFADQLHAAGFAPVIDPASVPSDANSPTKLHALPYLRDMDAVRLTHIALIGAESNHPESLNQLRRLILPEDVQVHGFGRFETPQDEISATSRLAYVTGRQPHMTDMATTPLAIAGKSTCPCFGVNIEMEEMPHLRGLPNVVVVASDLEQSGAAKSLQALSASRSFNALIYMSGKDKSDWIRQFGPGGHVYGFSEVSPTALSKMSNVLIMTGPIGNNYSTLCLLNNHVVSGGAIIDATPDGAFERAGYPVHRGPVDLGYMSHFLQDTILPNLAGITETAKTSRLKPALSLATIFGETPPPKVKNAPKQKGVPRIHFMPTNGNGLGHAQRCVQIANELGTQQKNTSFFAFPSCLPMITDAGYEATPLVSRSSLHTDPNANDLANYPRLSTHLSPGDVFVFDGGYTFDSVCRTIVDRGLRSVWIRRGLWSADQDNRIPLDREKYFARVLEPTEAIDTLNQPISSGAHIRQIGPIVRQVDATPKSREALYKALQAKLDCTFDKLVVTMLGSGMLHNLSANVQTVCHALERRDDVLNLIIVWPSAVVPSERYAWTRSKVVKTMQASWLAAHADFVVSAAGYNSFHEAMYNHVPTIFVPQSAQMLDDQAARADAAAKLGLAAHVPAGKLSQLDRELRKFADEGKANEVRAALKAHSFHKLAISAQPELIGEMIQ